MRHNVCYDSHAVGAGFEHGRGPFGGDATDGHQGALDPFAPFGEARQPLRRPGHLLQFGGVDRAQGDVVRARGERRVELLFAMGADADLETCTPDGGKIGVRQVLLAEMHQTCSSLDGLAPIVVDDQLAAMISAERESPFDLGANDVFARLLDPQLHELDALRQKAREPGGVGNDWVERVETEHVGGQDAWSILKNGVPATGVEGVAMSRGSMSPAS